MTWCGRKVSNTPKPHLRRYLLHADTPQKTKTYPHPQNLCHSCPRSPRDCGSRRTVRERADGYWPIARCPILAVDQHQCYIFFAHIRVGSCEARPLPVHDGRVQGHLFRLRQLSGSSLILEVCMANLRKLRDDAHDRQGGHCWYCRRPMSPADGLKLNRCTAEHLLARCEGGKDTRENVVAACWYCNNRRHKRKRPLSPKAYRTYVLARLSKGKWCLKPARRHVPTSASPIPPLSVTPGLTRGPS
ncbi:HNH endonuclease [Devosia rhodophyticola]|uniref:HNH endonuclease n=1 Tax=Devosia rhodophyticola TaxID=3026423 RepID=UPI0038994437